jgi:hypothetical protein
VVPTARATQNATAETISRWYQQAVSACDPFLFPESRFRTPWMDDELALVLERASRWLEENPCPDQSIDGHLRAILAAYTEMTAATVARVMELRKEIESHGREVDRRRVPRS